MLDDFRFSIKMLILLAAIGCIIVVVLNQRDEKLWNEATFSNSIEETGRIKMDTPEGTLHIKVYKWKALHHIKIKNEQENIGYFATYPSQPDFIIDTGKILIVREGTKYVFIYKEVEP